MNLRRINTDAHQSPAPLLSVYGDLGGHINAAADRRWFAGHEYVRFWGDADAGLLGLEPTTDPNDGYVLALSRKGENDYGGDISPKPILRDVFGLTPDDVTETTRIPLEWRDDHDPPVALADLGEHLPVATTATAAELEKRARAAVADGCESVQALADALSTPDQPVSEDRARTIAMDAGLYGDLRDDPGGYGRPAGGEADD